jgi:hypothetical protein
LDGIASSFPERHPKRPLGSTRERQKPFRSVLEGFPWNPRLPFWGGKMTLGQHTTEVSVAGGIRNQHGQHTVVLHFQLTPCQRPDTVFDCGTMEPWNAIDA